MADEARVLHRPTRYRAVLALAVAMAAATPFCSSSAHAQFFWNRGAGVSADDAARVAIEHGFRVLARPVRNDDIYLVEVIDRRGARERLVVTADSGEIVRRLFVQSGPRYRRDDAGEPVQRPAPDDDHRPGFFARLFGGDDTPDDDARPERSDRDVGEPDEPPQRRVRSHRSPHYVEQSPERPREAPIESAPLPPPGAAPSLAPRPPRVRPPVQASLPQAPASLPPRTPIAPAPVTPAGGDHPVRSISSNPLAIPGSREQDDKGGKAAQQSPPVKGPELPRPRPPVAPKDPVAVAPLD